MPVRATVNATEDSTFVVTCAFTDEDDNPVVPSSITWSLENASGAAVNNRTDVTVSTPAASINIVLTGDDLALESSTAKSELRRLIVKAVYSSSLGSDLDLADSYEFRLQNLDAV